MAKLPRGIRERGGSYQWDIYRKGQRLTGTAATLPEAIDQRTKAEAKLVLGLTDEATPGAKAPGGGWSLQQAFDRCVEEHWKGMPAEITQTIYATEALRFFGTSHPIAEIDSEAGIAYVRHCIDELGNKPSTVSKKVSVIRTMLRHATKYKNSGVTSVPTFDAPKKTRGRTRYLSDREEQAVLATLTQWGKPDHVDCIIALIDTGLRPNELYNIEVRDVVEAVSHANGVLVIYGNKGRGTKNGDVRSIPMTTRVRDIVQRRIEATTRDAEKLFPYNNPWMRHTWDNMRHHLGYGDDTQFVPYICRHTCCSRLVLKGVPLPVVQAWMGHKSITMTMRYAQLAPTSLFDAVSALEPEATMPLTQAVAASTSPA